MQRYHTEQEQAIIDRHCRDLAANQRAGRFPEETVQRGRYRKMHPYDCGNPRCCVCRRHWPRELTLQEEKAAVGMREQLAAVQRERETT